MKLFIFLLLSGFASFSGDTDGKTNSETLAGASCTASAQFGNSIVSVTATAGGFLSSADGAERRASRRAARSAAAEFGGHPSDYTVVCKQN